MRVDDLTISGSPTVCSFYFKRYKMQYSTMIGYVQNFFLARNNNFLSESFSVMQERLQQHGERLHKCFSQNVKLFIVFFPKHVDLFK